jgi:AdoMet-dependent heme synthase
MIGNGTMPQHPHTTGNGHGAPVARSYVYAQAPALIYWEMTRACDLACRHCRAKAIAERDPQELTTAEARAVLEQVQGFGGRGPHLVLTGGDPLKRPDFFELLEYGARLGLHISVAPSGTAALTRATFRRFKECGVESISLSLDGPTAEKHDEFRGVPGCFDRTVEAAREAQEEGLLLQINTLVTAGTDSDLPELYEVVRRIEPMRWSLFFLIQIGRGEGLREVSAERAEEIHNWLYGLSKTTPFTLATTEAPHYRRVAITRMRAEGRSMAEIRETPVGRGFGIRDGNGVMFISHTGDVCPAGFLPLVAGNARQKSIVEIYRNSEIFQKIRRPEDFKGRCGICEFKEICGGSRARAFAASGDCLGDDRACVYQPAKKTSVPAAC